MTFYRRNLPHWHPENRPIFLTWRLYNSLPASLLNQACTAKSVCATQVPPGRRFKILDAALDKATTGPLWLKDPAVASQIIQTLRKGESALNQYSLHSFVIMPNHVHLLISPKAPVSRIMNGIKGVTSRHARSMNALTKKVDSLKPDTLGAFLFDERNIHLFVRGSANPKEERVMIGRRIV